MNDNPNQRSRAQAATKHVHDKDDDQWFRISRDTFKRLKQELIEMPVNELNTLPEDIQVYAKNIRGNSQGNAPFVPSVEGIYDSDKIKRKKKHRQRLSDRAEEILNHINEYYPWVEDYTLVECVVGEDLEFDRLLQDYLSGCLFVHLKNEYPVFSKLKSWSDLPINHIREWDLINILGSKAEKGIFKGKCDICKGWK